MSFFNGNVVEPKSTFYARKKSLNLSCQTFVRLLTNKNPYEPNSYLMFLRTMGEVTPSSLTKSAI